MDFRQLQYFAAAVEQRSMSAAARACRVSQPTLSAQVRRLELELDEVLFGRTAVGLRPTKSAQRLYQRLSPILDDAVHGFRYIRSGHREPIEILHVEIACSAASLMGLVARHATRALETKYPYLKVTHHASETGLISARMPRVQLRHGLRSAAKGNTKLSDAWLLVEVATRQKGNRRSARDPGKLIPFGDVVDLPALPRNILEALAKSPGFARRGSLKMHGEDAAELIVSMLARNNGQVLLPRLAVSPVMLRHPRLRVREVKADLPPLSVVVEVTDPDDHLQCAYRAAIEERLVKSQRQPDTVPPASTPPDTKQLRYFLRAFDEGCITRAATKLNVVQPAVSMQIRTLERSLGGRLFDRTRQGIYPTAFGRRVRTIYSPILEALQGGRSSNAAGRLRARSILRVGVLPGLDEDSLLVQATTAAIMDWRKAFANVELKVVEAHSGVLLDWLADNVIDVAIVEDMHAHTSLKHTVLCTEPLALLTATSQSICPPGPIKMADIAKLDLVLPSPRHGLRALLDRKFADAGLPLVPKLELDSMASAVRLVKSGGWATVMPSSAVRRSLADHILDAHPIVQPSIMRELRSVQLPRQPKRSWEKEFTGFLHARLSSQLISE